MPAGEIEWQLGALPMPGHHWQHLLINEPPRAVQVAELLLGQLASQQEVIGTERPADVGFSSDRHRRIQLLDLSDVLVGDRRRRRTSGSTAASPLSHDARAYTDRCDATTTKNLKGNTFCVWPAVDHRTPSSSHV